MREEIEELFDEEAEAEKAAALGARSNLSSASLHVPGSAAKPVDILALWSSLLRWVLNSKTDFSCFLHIYLRDSLPVEGSTALPVWLMPAPYPELWKACARVASGGNAVALSREQRAKRKMMNLVAVTLSWLRLGSPRKPPARYTLGLRCTSAQWKVIRRLESFLDDVAGCGIVGPAEMGRSAAKMEGLDSILGSLHASSMELAPAAYAKSFAKGADMATKSVLRWGSDALAAGEVVGKLRVGAPVFAKEVEPSRLSLPIDKPAFDPSPFLEEPHLSVYRDPVASATAPAFATESPPRVRVHTKKRGKMELLQFLDSHHRLALAPAEEIRTSHLCGAFALVKDIEKDRLILDARAPNLLEETLRTWCSTLGSSQSLTQLELGKDFVMRFSGTDLKDYYHCFRVSLARSRRNALALPLSPKEASKLSCFSERLWHSQCIYPCLTALAMGDNQAVELGQKAHIKLGLASEAFAPAELLTVHGRAPRGMLAAGVVIDDVLLAEQVEIERAAEGADVLLESVKRLNQLCEKYLQVGLTSHPAKTFRGESRAECWGVLIDGDSGLVRPNPKRLIPLLHITSQVAKLQYASVGLLEVLAGAWCSILQIRRRAMCLLELIYAAQRGRARNDLLALSAGLVQELWTLVILGPMIVTELRASSLEELYMSDASEWGTAAVVAPIPACFSRELQRHCLARGVWAKLLVPWKAWLREHDELAPGEELPDGVPLVSHPIWRVLAEVLQFRLLFRERAHGRKHINLLEMEAVFKLEEKLATRGVSLRYLLGADSQVALAALLKGRSSSPRINAALRRSLPVVLGGGIYGNYGFIPSLLILVTTPPEETRCGILQRLRLNGF